MISTSSKRFRNRHGDRNINLLLVRLDSIDDALHVYNNGLRSIHRPIQIRIADGYHTG